MASSRVQHLLVFHSSSSEKRKKKISLSLGWLQGAAGSHNTHTYACANSLEFESCFTIERKAPFSVNCSMRMKKKKETNKCERTQEEIIYRDFVHIREHASHTHMITINTYSAAQEVFEPVERDVLTMMMTTTITTTMSSSSCCR